MLDLHWLRDTYNKPGQMTDDGKNYTFVFDGFGRLRKIKNRSNGNVVEEFWYNGLNHRICWKYDTDTDGDVDANDKKYHFAYEPPAALEDRGCVPRR